MKDAKNNLLSRESGFDESKQRLVQPTTGGGPTLSYDKKGDLSPRAIPAGCLKRYFEQAGGIVSSGLELPNACAVRSCNATFGKQDTVVTCPFS